MPRTNKKKTTAKKANKNSAATSNARHVVCPYTNQKVFVAKATLQDLKQKSTSGGKQKRLWTIASAQTRQEHYEKVAQAIAIVEQDLLPPSGGRSWEVSVTLAEPNAKVLFRNNKGKMELAVLPNLLERIPPPPAWPGKHRQAPDEYEAMQGEEAEAVAMKKHYHSEQNYIQSLTTRDVDSLSRLAFEVLRSHPHNHPIPVVTTKWKSPDARTFTSRKAAWEYAETLAKQEVFINKNLLGIGASGKLLQAFFPSPKTALELGKLRFVRDGLWVIGQELGWQEARPEEWQAQQEEKEEEKSQQVYISGLQMYVQTQRHQYKHDNADACTTLQQADKELRKQWRMLPPQEQQVWNDKVVAQFESSSEEESSDESGSEASSEEEIEYVSPLQFFLQKRRHDYRYERQLELKADKFTLAQADKELRKIWKEMSEEEQDEWIAENESGDEEDDSEAEEENSSQESEKESKTESEKRLTDENEKSEENQDHAVAETQSVSTFASIGSRDVGKSSSAKTTEEASAPTNLVRPVSANSHADNAVSQSAQYSEGNEEEVEDHAIMKCGDNAKITSLAPSALASSQVKSTNEDERTASTKVLASPPQKSKPVKVEETKNMNEEEPGAGRTTEDPVTGIRSRAKPPPPKTTQRYCMKPKQISLCYDACMDHFDTVMRTVKTRDLARELADGFDVLRERGRGRFDMELPAFDTPSFDFLHNFKKTPWMPVVQAILGEDVVLIHKGCFLSLPGAGAQVYHQDGLHLNKQTQQPCHAVNVFIPLVDLQMKNGPTEFVLGSHVLGHEGYDRDFLETPTPTAGTPVIFDYRLGHRGLSNSSHSVRPIVYCTYARAVDGKEFRDQVNFSRKRYHKIGDLAAKPLSREERKNKRKKFVESQEEAAIRRALELSAAECAGIDDSNIKEKLESGSESKKPKLQDSTQSHKNTAGEKDEVIARRNMVTDSESNTHLPEVAM
jgi:hypothetical protein